MVKNILYWIALFTLVLLFIPVRGYTFSEDICNNYKDTTSPTNDFKEIIHGSFNCHDLNCNLDEDEATSNQSGSCTSREDSSETNPYSGLYGRSSIHYDVVWLLARLQGMSKADASRLAAYSQSIDPGQYTHYDYNGKAIEHSKTDNLNGIMRSNTQTYGYWLHNVPWYKDEGDSDKSKSLTYNTSHVTGESPFSSCEKPLNHLRQWAFGQRDTVCTFGITDDSGNCYNKQTHKTIFMTITTGSQVSVDYKTILGKQKMKACDDTTDTDCYESNYDVNNKGTLKAFGIYLHSISDRLSHILCSNYSFLEKNTDTTKNYDYRGRYSTCCSQTVLASMHHRETGYPTLPKRSVDAVYYTMYEIADWIKYTGYSVEQTAITDSQILESIAQKIVDESLTEKCAPNRVKALCEISKNYGLGWHDGKDECKYKVVSCD
ncbi:MAG: hypothetical protein L3V56_02060 [Candidatus Magnetoovum sp. WYHC-5]|nr:hypothetical protein [Candidatus Magnetoovum sp. WYHC-5]